MPEDGGGDAARPTSRHDGRGDLREGVRVPPMELLEYGEGATFDPGFIERYNVFFLNNSYVNLKVCGVICTVTIKTLVLLRHCSSLVWRSQTTTESY